MRSLIVAVLVLSFPFEAAAQSLFRAPVVGDGRAQVSASAHDTVADAVPGGDTIAAIHFDSDLMVAGHRVRSLDAGRTVALTRLDPAGRPRWIRRFAEEAGPGQPHLRIVSNLRGLSDGGALIGGSYGDGGLDQGVLSRIDGRGQTRWELHPTQTTDYSSFVPVLTDRGTAIVLGTFFRGTFQLPGAPAWSSRQRFTSFLAEVELATGAVRWASRIPGEGRHLTVGPLGTIVVVGQFQRQLRVARSRLAGVGERDVFLARFDADGAPIDAVAYGTSAEDHPRGVVALATGGFSVLVSAGTNDVERSTLLGFDTQLASTFQFPLGQRAELVTSRGASSILVARLGSTRTVRVRGTPYNAVDGVQLVRFSPEGQPVGNRNYQLPGTGILTRSVHTRQAGDRVVFSGAMCPAGQSESFHVWLTPPPDAVRAQVGTFL